MQNKLDLNMDGATIGDMLNVKEDALDEIRGKVLGVLKPHVGGGDFTSADFFRQAVEAVNPQNDGELIMFGMVFGKIVDKMIAEGFVPKMEPKKFSV